MVNVMDIEGDTGATDITSHGVRQIIPKYSAFFIKRIEIIVTISFDGESWNAFWPIFPDIIFKCISYIKSFDFSRNVIDVYICVLMLAPLLDIILKCISLN